MSNFLSPNNATSYLGVKATTPPQMIVMERAPTTKDYIGYVLGTQWLHYTKKTQSAPATGVQYVLVSVANNIGTWVPLSGGDDNPTLPDHSVALGTGIPGLNSTSPASIGQLLMSNGASADPSFALAPIATQGAALISNGTGVAPSYGVVSVSGGGTGQNDAIPYSVVCGGTTSEAPLQQVVSLGTAGEVLTSQGNGSLPIWSAAGAGGTGGPIAVQVFTTSGTYTPTVGMGSVTIEVVGSGAGGRTATSPAGGGGGGSGAYARKTFLAAAIGASQVVNVAGGGASDTDGALSSVGALISANGGSAGVGSFLNGGAGGAAGVSGDVNVAGGNGDTGDNNKSGFGGSNLYGAGGQSRLANADTVGQNGFAYGSGGSGGAYLTTNQAGGAGANGIVICTEYGPYGILPPVSGTTINVRVYDTPGADVYVPSPNTQQVQVECQGAGGGTGGAYSRTGSFTTITTNGGGAGGYSKRLFNISEIGVSQPLVVGAGGTAGTAGPGVAGTPGGDGGLSSFGSFLTSNGGLGSDYNNNNSGSSMNPIPFGGAATGGDINIAGQTGACLGVSSVSSPNSSPVFGGNGGSSLLGFGGAGAQFLSVGSAISGNQGTGYGSGGGAPMSIYSGTAASISPGTVGTSGVIIITEYIN